MKLLIIQLKYLFFSPIFTLNNPPWLDNNANAALIDDELANTKASKQLICDPNNYTIYERFQDIEHGDELILTIWKNWGTRTDVQFKLKIKKRREEPADDDDDDRMSTKSKVSTSIID